VSEAEKFSTLFEIGGRDLTTASYDVGGVISPRPFRLRRLGLGISDILDLRLLPGLEQVVSNVTEQQILRA
jgi:hypothetical protein